MHESEEKSTYRLPLPFSKLKDGASDDIEEVEEGEAAVAREPVKENFDDNEDTGDIPVALQRKFFRLSARQDELAHR